MSLKSSPEAAARLIAMIQDDSEATMNDWDEAMGETDCEHGCYVEPDGYCCHGFKSAGLTSGVI